MKLKKKKNEKFLTENQIKALGPNKIAKWSEEAMIVSQLHICIIFCSFSKDWTKTCQLEHIRLQ